MIEYLVMYGGCGGDSCMIGRFRVARETRLSPVVSLDDR